MSATNSKFSLHALTAVILLISTPGKLCVPLLLVVYTLYMVALFLYSYVLLQSVYACKTIDS